MTDWAVQNKSLEAVQFLCEHYEVDMLQKNSFGISILTDAFQCQVEDILALCFTHPSASEENLLRTDPSASSVVKDDAATSDDPMEGSENNAIEHEFNFTLHHIATSDTLDTPATVSTPITHMDDGEDRDAVVTMKIRELAITRADNPFGTDTNPENDTTGLGIWPAAILLARVVIQHHELIRGKVVLELGAGVGVPGIAAALYCHPAKVYMTDVHQPTLDNLQYNMRLNSLVDTQFIPKKVDWTDAASFPQELADIVIGSDLVYDGNILNILIPALMQMLKAGKSI